jgi:hypothetical protein
LIEAWRAKKVTGLGLMRGLVSYGDWEVPISAKATAEALADNTAPSLQLSTSKGGKLCLMLFSSADAYKLYRQANAIATEQHFLKTNGTWLFRLPMNEVDQIWIDALTPYDVFYGKEHFVRLAEMAEAVAVEAALAGLRRGDAPDGALQRVKTYANYYVAVTIEDGKPALSMAPDDKGRRLAAVFTADDTFDAFAAEEGNRQVGKKIEQVQMSGGTLFDTLRRATLDGFVFNCAGPIAPVAFAQAVAGIVLDS